MAFLILLKYMVLTKSSIAIIFTAKNTKFNDKKKLSLHYSLVYLRFASEVFVYVKGPFVDASRVY